jgi:hypothetical protein
MREWNQNNNRGNPRFFYQGIPRYKRGLNEWGRTGTMGPSQETKYNLKCLYPPQHSSPPPFHSLQTGFGPHDGVLIELFGAGEFQFELNVGLVRLNGFDAEI